MKRIIASALALTAALFGVAAATAPDQQAPIASVKELMLTITIPTSETVFKMASDGPKNDAEWDAVARDALVLAESANLLMMPGRGSKDAAWAKFSVAQRDAAVVAMKAAQSKNADALSNASDALYETCDNCHKQYMKKN